MHKKHSSNVAAAGLACAAACVYPMLTHAESAMLEEVLVIAQKRTQTLQDVPISVNILSGDELAATGTRSFEDLRSATPGLFISGSPDGQAQGITIRGVGSQAFTDTQRPNVGVFFDGVPRRRLDGAFNQVLDIASVEVLKGPQSTLYGKEVSAGAILMNSHKPSLDGVDVELAGSLGSNEFQELRGVFNLPLGEQFALRAAMYDTERDEQIRNVLSGDYGQIENRGARLRLLWDISDSFSAILSYERHENEMSDSMLERLTYGSNSTAIPKTLPADPYDRKVESALFQGRENTNETTYLHLDWQLSQSLELNSITSYNTFDRSQVGGGCVASYSDPVACRQGVAGGDGGYLAEPVLVFGNPEQTDETFTQEFQLSYESENLSSLVGVFYNDFEITKFGGLSVYLPLVRIPGLAPDGLALLQGQVFDEQDWSVFTHNTYSFSDQWDVIFGLSYSDSERKRARYQLLNEGAFATPPTSTDTFTMFWDDSWDNVSGTLKFAYAFSDDLSFYGGLATGFRPGGFNNAGPGFDEETSTAWELGAKGRFYDGRLRANGVLFFQTFDDYQVQSFDLALGALGNVFTNAAEVEISGVEFDFSWLATDGLIVSGAVSYVDARYDKFENAPCNYSQSVGLAGGCEVIITEDEAAIEVQDLSGKRLANNSPLTANLNAEYRGALGSSRLEWYVRGDAVYRDDFYSFTNLEPLTRVDDYTLFNARVALASPDGGWEVALWGKNLTDEDYITGLVPGRDGPNSGDGLAAYIGSERSYGIDLRYHYSP